MKIAVHPFNPEDELESRLPPHTVSCDKIWISCAQTDHDGDQFLFVGPYRFDTEAVWQRWNEFLDEEDPKTGDENRYSLEDRWYLIDMNESGVKFL